MSTVTSAVGQPIGEVPRNIAPVTTVETEHDVEKRASAGDVHDDLKPQSDDGSEIKQPGVQRVEAITSVWSKKMLLITFILLYLVSFVDMLLQSVQSNLIAYVTSSFSQHGLLATTSVVSTILGGVLQLPIAKVINIWGRLEGFLAMLLLITIGMVMKATCQNVETYAAAHTFYWVGHLGLLFIISVVIADMTSLKNRMIMFGINTTPTIATTFAGPKIAELFYEHANFRWAFGAFSIILIVCCSPVAVIFLINERKAKKLGVAPEKIVKRNLGQSAKYYFVQFDVIGMLLCSAGFCLILLPFSLATSQPKGWASPSMIVMIVIGVLCLAAFGAWERFYATIPFLPFKFLKDRTVLGACLAYGLMFVSIFCWDTYYYSYLQVVHEQSISHAGYILNAFSLTSSFIAPFAGIVIRVSDGFKWPGMAGIPFCVLGTALLIKFRTPETAVGYLVMCQVFNGIAGGLFAAATQIAVMAAIDHQDLAVILALLGLFGSIGAAIGIAIAGALWTNVLPSTLYDLLPDENKNLTAVIYGDMVEQMSYPRGTPIRDAINAAYGDVQRKMVIAGAAFIPLLFVSIIVWKNLRLKEIEARKPQTKGNVW